MALAGVAGREGVSTYSSFWGGGGFSHRGEDVLQTKHDSVWVLLDPQLFDRIGQFMQDW